MSAFIDDMSSPSAVRLDPVVGRSPVPLATTVRFPDYVQDASFATNTWSTSSPPPCHRSTFASMKIRRGYGLTDEHIKSLNITIIIKDCAIEDIVVTSVLADHRYLDGQDLSADALPSMKQCQDAYKEAMTELLSDNNAAYIEVTRQRSDTDQPIPFSSLHGFWSYLQLAAMSWATTRDEYSIRDVHPLPREEHYRGFRTSNGQRMPATVSKDIMEAFLVSIGRPFRVYLRRPAQQPYLEFGRVAMMLPLKDHKTRSPRTGRETSTFIDPPPHFSLAYHAATNPPQDGKWEGPLLATLTRPYVDFGTGTEEGKRAKARIDVVYEMAALLYDAQLRRRQGKQDPTQHTDKWWNTKAPCGAPQGPWLGWQKTAARVPGWNHNKWLQWDRTTVHKAVGKEAGSSWDEVYLVFGLNHHFSVVKLRVHDAYLDLLESGKLPDALPAEEAWCRPTLQRTGWWDLFVAEDRAALLRCVWGVMAHLTRAYPAASGGHLHGVPGDLGVPCLPIVQ